MQKKTDEELDGSEETPFFPCHLEDQWFTDRYSDSESWHWHTDMELGIVTDGTLQVRDNDSAWTVREGDGYFFNSGIMHEMRNMGNKGAGSGHLLSVDFNPDMIAVLPRSSLQSPRGLLFAPEIPWQKEVLDKIKKIFITGTTKNYGYEMAVLSLIADIMHTIITVSKADASVKKEEPDGKKIMDETRTKAMLDFINKHYAENISVSDLASEAHISESECFRIFKRMLATTPVNYLLEYRIRTAANELLEEGKSISEICYDTGFNSPAYFTKVFREYAGYTPKEFRTKLS